MSLKILQLVSADRWDAVFATGKNRTRVPLIGWALVPTEDGGSAIKGVMLGPNNTKVFCEDQPEFVTFIPRDVTGI